MNLAAFTFAFLLVAIPFGMLFWACVRKHGWEMTICWFGLACLGALWIYISTSMMKGFQ